MQKKIPADVPVMIWDEDEDVGTGRARGSPLGSRSPEECAVSQRALSGPLGYPKARRSHFETVSSLGGGRGVERFVCAAALCASVLSDLKGSSPVLKGHVGHQVSSQPLTPSRLPPPQSSQRALMASFRLLLGCPGAGETSAPSLKGQWAQRVAGQSFTSCAEPRQQSRQWARIACFLVGPERTRGGSLGS